MNRSSKQWIESFTEHAGKFIDRLKPSDIIDAFAYLGVGYLGYHATQDIKGALIGVIGLKLAQAPGGTLPLSQGAGLAILGGLGLITLGDTLGVDQPWMPQDWFKWGLGVGEDIGEELFGALEEKEPTKFKGIDVPALSPALGTEILPSSFGGWGEGSLYAYRQSVREAIGTAGHNV